MTRRFEKRVWLGLIAAILIIAIGLRFYRLEELFYFMIDEERYSFLMKRLWLDRKLMLVGVAIPGGIYLGPAYFYFSGLLQFIFKFNPVMMAGTASLVGVMATGAIYWTGGKFFGKRVALGAMAVYACSWLIVVYNRIYWTLTWTSVAALLTYWGLYQIITQKKYWYIWPMAAIYILGSQSDASYFSLIITAVILLVKYMKRQHLSGKKLILPALVWLAAQLPVVAFELRHNFYNTQLILKLFSGSSLGLRPALILRSLLIFPKTLARLLMIQPPYDVTYQLSPTRMVIRTREQAMPQLMVILAALILGVFLLKRWKGKKPVAIEIIKTHLWVVIGGVLAYSLVFPGYVHEWFITILFPAVALIIGLIWAMVSKQKWGLLVTLALIFSLFKQIQAGLKTENDFGLAYKRQAVKYAIEQVGDKSFYLDAIGSQAYGGYRYLFWLYGKEPVHSYMDNVYGNWIYPMPETGAKADLAVVIANLSNHEPETETDKVEVNQLRQAAFAREKFGEVEVLVLNATDRP